MKNNRRDFIKVGLLAGTMSSLYGFGINSQKHTGKSSGLKEPSRTTPVVQDTDVIVCGAGPAGIAAAINAARTGARTTLIEYHGCLGGVWTSGLLSFIIDYENKAGIMAELMNRIGKTGNQHNAQTYDAELMKWTLEQMCLESGVNVRLYTRVVAAHVNSSNKLEHIITESFSGREAWKAKVFIDTTGNGELSAKAGCSFEIGHPDTGKTQPGSLMAILTGLDEKELIANGLITGNNTITETNKRNLYNEIKRGGYDASYTMPTLFSVRPGMVAMMANHQYGISVTDADSITHATLEARNELNNMVNGLRSLKGVWSDLRLAVTGSQIGIREGRRIKGLYTVSKEDIIKGSKFEDAVCRVTFPVDVHSLEKSDGGGYGKHGVIAKPFDIPVRSLIAKDVNGLMMAGRCISGDFFAHASYRVTGNAVAMGEAAGLVAAKASLSNKLPQEIEFKSNQ